MREGDSVTEAVDTVTAPARGEVALGTEELPPGGYDVVMSDRGEEIARNEFWVRSVEDDIVLRTDRKTYAPASRSS